MRGFCIFDDFPTECLRQLEALGVTIDSIGVGQRRPTDEEMKAILERYEIVIIGTSQKIQAWMWEQVRSPRIVATASVGIDHIVVPRDKRGFIRILNTPAANAQSVAEYTVGAMIMARKRFSEGDQLYREGKTNKALVRKPEDIHSSVVGLVGAGHIGSKIIELLHPFGVRFVCNTKNPLHHKNLAEEYGVTFVPLESLAKTSDLISVNVPLNIGTKNMIDSKIIDSMKNDCVFVSTSREGVSDNNRLLLKAEHNPNFYVFLDYDLNEDYVGRNNGRNIVITPHIAGGTIEARKRMFKEVAQRIALTLTGEED